MHATQRPLTAAILAFALLGARAAEPAAAPSSQPAKMFFALASMDQPRLSPDGKSLAMLVVDSSGRRKLAVMDSSDSSSARVIAGYADADVATVEWVANDRLIYRAWDQHESAWQSRAFSMLAIDIDGQHQRRVVAGHNGPTQVVRTLGDDTGQIVAAVWSYSSEIGYGRLRADTYPKRYDTRTGQVHDIVQGKVPYGIQSWIADEQGHMRAALSSVGDTTRLLVPGEQGDTWVERTRFKTWESDPNSFRALGIATDGQLYVEHSTGMPGSGRALYRFDLASGHMDAQPVVSAKGFDINPELVEDRARHKVIGVHYLTDAPSTLWFDEDMKKAQATVDKQLPGRVNRIDPAVCGCASRMLVTSFSDHQPAQFFLFDRADGSLRSVGTSHPDVDAHLAADTDFTRIQARDGHDLPVWVTKPRGKGPWPAVVLVHGGPIMRGWNWEWDGESQFLASRGYVVIKPEFRGSDGYGDQLRGSGFRQWGLTMQDDIADATRWAFDKGLADPQRTCIAGGSYGGYATLMGLVRYPELYRCGIAWSAVTDLQLLKEIGWSDMSFDYREFGFANLVGDPDKDAAQFEQTSPLRQAAKITRPLLLAHGGVDRRVPIDHATKMRDALQAAHAPLTWIEYKDEAHGWYKPENREDFYQRVEAFLGKNIGPEADRKP